MQQPPLPEPSASEQMYPGFTISHDKCQSTDVHVENDLGYSAMSGAWGDVRLVCQVCGDYVVVVEA